MLRKYDSIIFDLDGTLWNAAHTTALAWTQTFASFNIPLTVTKLDIENVAGKPYLDCLRIVFKEYDRFERQNDLLAALSIAEQDQIRLLGGEYYQDVEKTLSALKAKYPLFVVSNCQDWYLEAFLKSNDIGRFFVDSTCYGLSPISKDLNIKNIMQKHNLKKSVYIGDTAGDMHASAKAGVDFIHAKYGFDPSLNCELTINSMNDLLISEN